MIRIALIRPSICQSVLLFKRLNESKTFASLAEVTTILTASFATAQYIH